MIFLIAFFCNAINTIFLSSPNNYQFTSDYEIWLRKDIDDSILRKIAETMVLSHEQVKGNLTGPLLLYKSQQDKIDGTQGEKTLDTNS